MLDRIQSYRGVGGYSHPQAVDEVWSLTEAKQGVRQLESQVGRLGQLERCK